MIGPALKKRFGDSIIDTAMADQEVITVSREGLPDVLLYLKTEGSFDLLLDIAGVDYLKWQGRKQRFEVAYHLTSLKTHERIRIKCPLDEKNLSVDSAVNIWEAADWFEREVFDMFGIHFRGHPKLRRLLMWDEFEGHPLRKDYPLDRRQPIPKPADIV